LFVVTADGGEGVSDAVREARTIIRAAANVYQEQANLPRERFAFEFCGSMQGFEPCPYAESTQDACLSNKYGQGLLLRIAGENASVSTPTFFDPNTSWQGYDAIASPSLYEGQTMTARFLCEEKLPPRVTPYVCFVSAQDDVEIVFGETTPLQQGETQIRWTIPQLGGQPIIRAGFAAQREGDVRINLRCVRWTGRARRKCINSRAHCKRTSPIQCRLSTSVCFEREEFRLSLTHTLCVFASEENGVVDAGYAGFCGLYYSALLTPQPNERCGLVARARGHRQYYAALLSGGHAVDRSAGCFGRSCARENHTALCGI
jgi:hypothetical protein